MKKILAISIASALCLGTVSHAFAGANPLAQLALDLSAKSKTRSCATMAATYTSCSVVNRATTVAAGSQNLDVVPVVYQFAGITAVQFGLDWAASTILYAPSWTKCSDLEITRVGTTNASMALTWSTCQAGSGVNGKATGFLRFTTYGLPGRLHLRNPDSGVPSTVDCQFQADELHTIHDGFVNGFAPGPSDLAPCSAGPTATEATTWSGVKALYH